MQDPLIEWYDLGNQSIDKEKVLWGRNYRNGFLEENSDKNEQRGGRWEGDLIKEMKDGIDDVGVDNKLLC